MSDLNDDPSIGRRARLVAILGSPFGAERSLAATLSSWLSDAEMRALTNWITRSRPAEPAGATAPTKHEYRARMVSTALVEAIQRAEQGLALLLADLLTETELERLDDYLLARTPDEKPE